MAKNNKRTLTVVVFIAIAGLIITLITMGVALVKGYTTIEVEAKQQNEARIELKNEGCLPAREAEKDISVLLEKVIEIKHDMGTRDKAVDRKFELIDTKLDAILEKL